MCVDVSRLVVVHELQLEIRDTLKESVITHDPVVPTAFDRQVIYVPRVDVDYAAEARPAERSDFEFVLGPGGGNAQGREYDDKEKDSAQGHSFLLKKWFHARLIVQQMMRNPRSKMRQRPKRLNGIS